MAEPSTASVRCPLCGEDFDPGAAGGWCTNLECGEWQYDGRPVPEPIESVRTQAEATPAEASAAEPGRVIEDASPPGDFHRELEQTTDGGGTDPTNESAPEADAAAEVPAWGPPGDGEAEPASTPVEGENDADTEPEEANDDAPNPAPESSDSDPGDGLESCPSCGASVEPADNFCSNCGTDLAEAAIERPLETCPNCEADVDETDRFCAGCGEHLDAHREGAVQQVDRLLLEARGQTVTVTDGDTVGREFRRIITETGGEVEDAVKIHREHVRFLREEGQFYLVDLGENPTVVNDERLRKGDRRPVEPGDTIVLSDVLTATVEEG